jgi:succinate dehydrogenase/fumarate reductase flavoprotein subunit
MAAKGTGNASTGGFDYDVLVVGSGFGGSVAALRLDPWTGPAPS